MDLPLLVAALPTLKGKEACNSRHRLPHQSEIQGPPWCSTTPAQFHCDRDHGAERDVKFGLLETICQQCTVVKIRLAWQCRQTSDQIVVTTNQDDDRSEANGVQNAGNNMVVQQKVGALQNGFTGSDLRLFGGSFRGVPARETGD